MIPKATVDQIKDTLRIEEVIGDYLNLKRSGSSLSGLCPFHGEKSPSFYVNPARQFFKCFGCGEAGDAIAFVMRHDTLTYVEALRQIAAKYNISIRDQETTPEQQAEQQRAQALGLVNDFARTFYHEELLQGEEGRSVGLSYFRNRGYSDEAIAKFELGYAPARGDALKQAAIAAGYQRDYLHALGLITQDGSRDFLRERVVFPIHGYSGKVVAFAGRVLRSDTKAPKYLNSPETELYVKNKVLYGMHLAKAAIRKEDRCLIVEGYADVIALHQAGVEHVVATSGTSLTDGHIKLIKRLTPRVTFLYDGDKAGVKAALRGLDLVLAEGMEVKLVLLPDNHDPDSYVKAHGGQAFQDFVEREAKDFISYKSDLVDEDAKGDPLARTRLVQEVLRSIALVPDLILRAEYVRTTSERFSLDEATLVAQLNQYIAQHQEEARRRARVAARNDSAEIAAQALPAGDGGADAGAAEPAFTTKLQPPGAQHLVTDIYRERDLVGVLVAFGHQELEPGGATVAEFICDNIQEVLDSFDDEICGRLIQEAHQRLDLEQPIDSSYWTGHEDPDIQRFAIDVIASPYELSPGWAERFEIGLTTQKLPELNWAPAAQRSITRFKLTKLLRKMDHVSERLRSATDPTDIGKLMHRYVRMEEVKKQFAATLGSVVLR